MTLADEAPTVADRSAPATPAADALAAPTFPPGARVVHIGPHKTGTTSLQAALHARRAELLRQGVEFAGKDSKSADAIRAVRGARAPSGKVPSLRHWQELVRQAAAAGPRRFVLSNEFLADAPVDAIRTIARDLEPDRIQVVATLRPLARILTSQWQQYVQGGLSTAFEPWLRETLDAPPADRPTGFWRRHRHDQLLRRWADVVGADRVTAIVVGDDPTALLQAFGRMLALREETLTIEEDPRNRSMTLPEIEAVRAVNLAFEETGLPTSLHYRLIQRGACEAIKARRPDPGEQRVALPAWSLARVEAISNELADGIEASGIQVVGALAALRAVPLDGPRESHEAPCVPPEVASALAMGLLQAAGVDPERRGRRPEPHDLMSVPTRQITVAVARRPVRALRRLRGGSRG